MKPLLTVFTPTYNRAKTLERTYYSLRSQTCKDFKWLIIDDGSSDNTSHLVEEWKTCENGFEIEYVYKKNGGMHTAHNLAYELIQTELNVCIDSDDLMPENAVETILNFWRENGNKAVAGIVALDSDFQGNVIGTEMPRYIKQASTNDLYAKYHVKGDKKFIYRSEIIKNVAPYPEFDGEKLVPLSYKYRIIAQKFEMLLLNEVVCLVDYQIDGSTNTIYKQYLNSPSGFAAYRLLCLQQSESGREKIKNLIQYIAECRISKEKKCLEKVPNKALAIAIYPLGILCELFYYWINKKHNL